MCRKIKVQGNDLGKKKHVKDFTVVNLPTWHNGERDHCPCRMVVSDGSNHACIGNVIDLSY